MSELQLSTVSDFKVGECHPSAYDARSMTSPKPTSKSFLLSDLSLVCPH